MSKASTSDWLRALMGTAEPQQAVEGAEGGSEAAAASPPASQDTEGAARAEAAPLTMNEILRGRLKRRIDIFGQPATEGTEQVAAPPADMNALIRAQAGRYVINDEPPAEEE